MGRLLSRVLCFVIALGKTMMQLRPAEIGQEGDLLNVFCGYSAPRTQCNLTFHYILWEELIKWETC